MVVGGSGTERRPLPGACSAVIETAELMTQPVPLLSVHCCGKQTQTWGREDGVGAVGENLGGGVRP